MKATTRTAKSAKQNMKESVQDLKHTLQENWDDFKTSLKKKWSKLTDKDFEGIKHDSSKLKEKIQSLYGHSKEMVAKELESIRHTFSSGNQDARSNFNDEEDRKLDRDQKISEKIPDQSSPGYGNQPSSEKTERAGRLNRSGDSEEKAPYSESPRPDNNHNEPYNPRAL